MTMSTTPHCTPTPNAAVDTQGIICHRDVSKWLVCRSLGVFKWLNFAMAWGGAPAQPGGAAVARLRAAFGAAGAAPAERNRPRRSALGAGRRRRALCTYSVPGRPRDDNSRSHVVGGPAGGVLMGATSGQAGFWQSPGTPQAQPGRPGHFLCVV